MLSIHLPANPAERPANSVQQTAIIVFTQRPDSFTPLSYQPTTINPLVHRIR